MSFGEQIRDARLKKGIKQAELARRMGIAQSSLSRAERGIQGTQMGMAMFVKAANAMEMKVVVRLEEKV